MRRFRLLLTNDDGWDSPGLAALKTASSALGELFVLAPSSAYSQCSHTVTTEGGLRLVQTGPECYRLEGAPADCVRVAIRSLYAEGWFDCVISGINRGGNLGADIHMSGTVAAAREAALLGVPAIAISQFIRRGLELDWAISAQLAVPVLEELLERGCEGKTFWNVNLPHGRDASTDAGAAMVVHCEPDDLPLDVRYTREGDVFRYAGHYQSRPRTPRRDVDLCFGGAVTVSKLRV